MDTQTDTIRKETTIGVPAERVFQALTNPDERLKWFGHGSFRMTQAESDLRVGGNWSLHNISEGKKSSARGEYRTIERPRVLAFTWVPDWYANATETLVRFDLAEHAGVTTLRLTHSGLKTDDDRAGTTGWPDVMASLRAYLEKPLTTGVSSGANAK